MELEEQLGPIARQAGVNVYEMVELLGKGYNAFNPSGTEAAKADKLVDLALLERSNGPRGYAYATTAAGDLVFNTACILRLCDNAAELMRSPRGIPHSMEMELRGTNGRG